MIVCPKCQTELPDKAYFCSNCGKKLTTPARVGKQTTAKKKRVSAKVKGSGMVVQGKKNVTATKGSVAVGGSVYGDIYTGVPPRNAPQKRRTYLEVLARQVNRLPMRTFDTTHSNPAVAARSLSLVNVYTALDTTTQVEIKKASGKRRSVQPAEIMERGETRPLRTLEAVARQKWLVLLGEPGSGKTTFAHHLIYCLAQGKAEKGAEWLAEFQRDWPPDARNLLPVRIILRDFDAWLTGAQAQAGQATTCDLPNFIAHTLKLQKLDFAATLIDKALEAGEALIVLDGLDEVTSLAQRALVRDAILALTDRYPHNRIVVTCRTWSYQPPDGAADPDLRLPEQLFPVVQLAPFTDGQIDQFIAAWHNELTRANKLTTAKAEVLESKLKRAVRQADLHRLARNPLQLTLMAWVHTDDEELPDKRAKLYDRAVDLLLWRWEAQKPDIPGVRSLRDLASAIPDGRGEIERVLWRAAFEAHAHLTVDDQRENPERLVDVDEARLKSELARLKKDAQGKLDENWARDVVDAIRERSGLLARRLPGTLTFPHRTFQEYLAALWLLQDRFVSQAALKAEQHDVWREVILLAIGHSVFVKKDYELEKPLALAVELCPRQADQSAIGWSKAWLAGDALQEIGKERVCSSALGCELLERVQHRLVDLLQAGALSPRERAAAGNTLARLGDPRPEVMTVDALPLCFVPKGCFWLGSEEPDDKVFLSEKPFQQYDLDYDYWLSRWPITNAQFRQFVEAGGYGIERYWIEAEANRAWETGQVIRRFYKIDERQQPKEIVERESAPHDFGEPFNLPNHPVVGVSWYEALAFTRWLTERWQIDGRLPENWVVRLPNEPEWEKAARGGVEISVEPIVRSGLDMSGQVVVKPNPQPQRRYPWGDQPDPTLANYADTDINATSAVGCFPAQLFSPYGCEDMSGNVWEWMRNISKDYPYTADDGREYLDSSDGRVLRGGSFYYYERHVRCAYRDGSYPYVRSRDIGFRLCVSSPF